ncbi:MAG TPA: serine/threonine-protein kinase [Roseiarcus sp.]|nr:serine/threonine-protein kinase [Roseiarcus sp.]
MTFDKTAFQPKGQGSLRPGVRLNGIFEIEQLIAEGGMGEVYKGVALASGDAVAIKLVRPEMALDPDVMALFKREAAILHDLLHDAIVRYYVFSLEPELQRYYIAMEFVDGASLQKRLHDGPLSPAEARILLKRIGGALQQAHERGVIHRDISSDNIILPGGDARKAKIVDFGIARATRPGEGTILGGGFAGKYKYVSPEQLGLMGGEVTPKSDIYSFGLVLAEALRGEPLDMGGSQAEVIEKRRVVPDLSGVDISLRPLLTAMLAPDPRDRPESMAEIAGWGEGATMLQAAAPAPAPPPKRGGAGLAIAAAVIVVAVGAGAAAYLWRDRLGLTGPASVATQATPSAALPPSASPTAARTTLATTPTPTKTEAAAQGPAVTVAALLEQMPPKPASSVLTLAPATVGAAYRAELPAFNDPTGQGLVLHAAPAPPAGLSFKALDGGRSEIAGAPKAAGDAVFDVVAVTQAGKSARMKVVLSVNPRPQAAPPRPQAAPPQPAQVALRLEPAVAGRAYSAGLPPFRSQESVTLAAGPGLPPGLTLNDLGNGLSQLAGAPRTSGDYAFDVIARTAGGAQGRMKVRIAVAAPPPPTVAPPPPSATVAPPPPSPTVAPPPPSATVALLPPSPTVAPPSPSATVALPPPLPTVAPPPPSPTVASLPSSPTVAPLPALPPLPIAASPSPTVTPPPASPTVAPPPPSPTVASASPSPTVASPTPAPATTVATAETPAVTAAAFLRDYPAVRCFAARLKDGGADRGVVAVIGDETAAFERFGAAFKQTVRTEPDLRGFLVRPSQCPAVDFLAAASWPAKGLPRVVLDSPLVGAGRPLSGTILGLGGRPLLLMVIDDDGHAFRLRAQASPGGESATFSASFTGDPSSIGKPQMVIAIASEQPIDANEKIDGAPSAALMPKLAAEAHGAGAAFALFKFVQ